MFLFSESRQVMCVAPYGRQPSYKAKDFYNRSGVKGRYLRRNEVGVARPLRQPVVFKESGKPEIRGAIS